MAAIEYSNLIRDSKSIVNRGEWARVDKGQDSLWS